MKQEVDTERTDENAPDVTVGESWFKSSLSLKTRKEQNQRQTCQTEGVIHRSFARWEWLNLTHGEYTREPEFKVF